MDHGTKLQLFGTNTITNYHAPFPFTKTIIWVILTLLYEQVATRQIIGVSCNIVTYFEIIDNYLSKLNKQVNDITIRAFSFKYELASDEVYVDTHTCTHI